MAGFPSQVDEITANWLNEVLDDEVGPVASFTTERLGDGVGILGEVCRLHLTYEPGATGPDSVVAKFQSPAAENQALARAMGFYLREVNFYRNVADTLEIRVPAAYHVDAADDGVPFVLLLEDIVGAHTPDQIAGVTAAEAGRIIDTVAVLHAEFWETRDLYELDWLPPVNNSLYRAAQQLAEDRWSDFLARFENRVGPKMIDTLADVIARYPDLLDWWVEQGEATFTHTDCRAENYLFGGPEGPDAITVVDFQLCTRHVGAWDVANLIGGSMAAEVRRHHETELLERYQRRLVELGVHSYSLGRCWRDYRMSLLHQAFSAIAVSDLHRGTDGGQDLLEELFLRPIQAATDQQVHELLGEF